MLLHLVSASPAASASLDSCLRSLDDDALILLMQDGVYAATEGSDAVTQIKSSNAVRCYALRTDVAARGLSEHVDAAVILIDYDEFVRLSVECHAVQSWF
jgi:tRNA 2-thiouridine synthesizing protein B